MDTTARTEPSFDAFLHSWTKGLLGYAIVFYAGAWVLTLAVDAAFAGLDVRGMGLRVLQFGMASLLMWQARRSPSGRATWFALSVTWFATADAYLNAQVGPFDITLATSAMVLVATGLFPARPLEAPLRAGLPALGVMLGLWWAGVPELHSAWLPIAMSTIIAATLAVAGRQLALRALDVQHTTLEATRLAESQAVARERFLRSLSHEMRTPLHGLIGLLSEIRHSPLTGRQAEALALADQAAGLLDMLVDDALDANQQPPRVRPMDVHVLVPVRAALASAMETQAIEVKRLPHGPVTLDPWRMQQLIQLLMSYVGPPPGPEARIVVDWKRDELVLAVRGKGQGGVVSSEGLQASLIRRVVEVLGGALTEASPGEGRIVQVRLPAPIAASSGHATSELEGLVLIVDDNRVNRMVLRSMVERLGATADEVEHGREALESLAERPYSIVLMDLDMPVMDGFEATRVARKRGFTCPIVAVTANTDPGARVLATRCGMDGLMTKPLRPEELAPVLRSALISRPTRSAGAAFREVS